MIFGINDTDPGSDSNGSGKSTLLEGISLAFTGLTCRDVGKDEFISDGSDESYVQLDLDNNLGDVNELSIRRWFHRKKSSKVEIWENGKLNKEITGVPEANKRIYELIGLSREDLLHFFIVGQGTNFSFLTVNDTDKKLIISRLADTDRISIIIDNLKKRKKELETGEYRVLQDTVVSIESNIELLEEQISEIKSKGKKEIDNRISKIKSDISDHKDEIKEAEESKDLLDKEQKKINVEIGEINVDDSSIKELEESIESLETKLSSRKKKLSLAGSTKNHLEMLKDGMIECPECKHEFNPASDIDGSEIDELISYAVSEEEEAQKLVNKTNKLISKKETELKTFRQNVRKKRELNDKLARNKRKLTGLDDEIEISKKAIEKFRKNIEQIEKQSDTKEQIKSLRTKIAENSKELEITKSSMTVFDTELTTIDYWIYHFSNKGFSTYLSNKSVKVIEGITNSFLKRFNSDLQVQIDGFTKKKNGELSEKISVSIVRNGQHIGNYKRYSGGEKGRINLANIVGLQKLMNMSAPNGGLNLLILDEVFDGLDVTGQKDVINILEGIDVTTLVVSHRNEPIGAENEVYIRKFEGNSYIV